MDPDEKYAIDSLFISVPFREKANVGNVEQEFRSSRLTFTETRDSNMDIFELKRIQVFSSFFI